MTTDRFPKKNPALFLQNKFIMTVGVLTFSGCVLYIAYMKHQMRNEKTYTALNDNDELVLRKKQSRWD